ncbi:histone deacetylase complex subunit SAP18 [Tanacetum coccineum]
MPWFTVTPIETHKEAENQVGGHHNQAEFAVRGKEPKGEVQIYTSMGATLRELTDLDWSSWIDTDITQDEYEYLDTMCSRKQSKRVHILLQAQEDIAFATNVVRSV